MFDPLNMIQLIDQPTWHRIVNNTLRESIIDHIYVQDPTVVADINLKTPLFGDHKLIIFNITGNHALPLQTIKRKWTNYSKDNLINALKNTNFQIETEDVQSSWNNFEMTLLPIIDNLVPLVPFANNETLESTKITHVIKGKMNLRKKLLKKLKIVKSNEINNRIRNLNVEIKKHFHSKKSKSVRRNIKPGNSKSLWDAVKTAKDLNTPRLPNVMFLNNIEVNPDDLPDTFASHFKEKIQRIVNDQVIDAHVFNGTQKVNTNNVNFMSESEILLAIKSLKPKNCEGHDRIPVRILIDGVDQLIKPLSYLFNKIYTTKKVPEQWLISKIFPVHKKGPTNSIENYRPISNLCACSKIFEKLILMRLNTIEKENKVDLTHKSQHGFKKNHSTLTAGLRIQSMIARAIDGDQFALMSSLDLSSAFDVVNVELLIKRLQIIGLPNDLVELVSEWLTNRYFYVSIDGGNSYVHHCDVGTVQGSILGPILYAMFVSPLLDLEKLILFADDNYILEWGYQIPELILTMKQKLERITKWLTDSGLKVNESKTEICLFHRKDQHPIQLILNGQILNSKPFMNVLGVSFDSKLNWQTQIQQTISKSKKAIQALWLIRKYFNKQEMQQLITSNFYSILYYNSEIWHLPSNCHNSKKNLLSASAAALKLCTPTYDQYMSFQNLHEINKRATPIQIMKYKLSIILYKTYNDESQSFDWLSLFFNQNFNARTEFVNFFDCSSFKIGKNLLSNRFIILNGSIKYDWLNLPFNSYKIKCKAKFL